MRKSGDLVVHVIRGHDLSEGDEVKGAINWDRRYRMMRLHTSLHILSAILFEERGAKITGSSISEDKARIDFNLERFDRELMEEVVARANEIVREAHPVRIRFTTWEEVGNMPEVMRVAQHLYGKIKGPLRLVEIEGIDVQLDGGTHVANTEEIGEIELLKLVNKGKNNRRIVVSVKP